MYCREDVVAVVPSENSQQHPTDFSALMLETQIKFDEKNVVAAAKKTTGKCEAKKMPTVVEVKSENVGNDDELKVEMK